MNDKGTLNNLEEQEEITRELYLCTYYYEYLDFFDKLKDKLSEEQIEILKKGVQQRIYSKYEMIEELASEYEGKKDFRHRKEKMNDFLNEGITNYNKLVMQNIHYYSFNEIFEQLKFINEWKEHFSNSKGIKYWDDKYFLLLFDSEKGHWNSNVIQRDNFSNNIKFNPSIKMYIPFDFEHMHDGVEKLFDFITREKIPHLSKIARDFRGDGIVVRIGSIEDTEKIADFVSKDEYLKKGLLDANPFVIQHKGIGIAVDGNLSFNEILNDLIQQYQIKNMKSRKSVEDFKQFIEEEYNKLVNANEDEKNNWRKKTEKQKWYRNSPELDFISYMSILDYLKIALNPEAKFKDFCEYYSRFETLEYPTALHNLYNGNELLHEEKRPIEYAKEKRDSLHKESIILEEKIQKARELLQEYQARKKQNTDKNSNTAPEGDERDE